MSAKHVEVELVAQVRDAEHTEFGLHMTGPVRLRLSRAEDEKLGEPEVVKVTVTKVAN